MVPAAAVEQKRLALLDSCSPPHDPGNWFDPLFWPVLRAAAGEPPATPLKAARGGYRVTVTRWSRSLIEHWAFQTQLLAVGLLGLAVLMPFVLVPAVIALAVTAVVLGPRGLLALIGRRAPATGPTTSSDRTPPVS